MVYCYFQHTFNCLGNLLARIKNLKVNYKKTNLCAEYNAWMSLNYFWPMFPFYTPWKHQKIKGFLVFSGGIKWEHWSEIGWDVFQVSKHIKRFSQVSQVLVFLVMTLNKHTAAKMFIETSNYVNLLFLYF